LKAVLLTGVKKESLDLHPLNWPLIEEVRARLTPQQKYIRGLFCGGTLCDEAMFAAMENMPKFTATFIRIRRSACKISTAAWRIPSSISVMTILPTVNRTDDRSHQPH
jgi:hypothetical protein